MRNKGNVKTKTLEFTHVKKVHTRKTEVVHLNMQLLLLLFGFFAEYCLNVCDSPALSLSLPVCVCVCVRCYHSLEVAISSQESEVLSR